jgi:hypothetical protein
VAFRPGGSNLVNHRRPPLVANSHRSPHLVAIAKIFRGSELQLRHSAGNTTGGFSPGPWEKLS